MSDRTTTIRPDLTPGEAAEVLAALLSRQHVVGWPSQAHATCAEAIRKVQAALIEAEQQSAPEPAGKVFDATTRGPGL